MPPNYPYNTPTSDPSRSPQRSTISFTTPEKKLEYVLPRFTFEENPEPAATTTSTGLFAATDARPDEHQQRLHQKRVRRYYGEQILIPDGSVSPCLNATDRARRTRKCSVRKLESTPETDQEKGKHDVEAMGDTTASLKPASIQPRSSAQKPYTASDQDWSRDEVREKDEILERDEIADMLIPSDDEEDLGRDFNIIKNEPMADHNGIAPGRQKGYWGLRKRFAF